MSLFGKQTGPLQHHQFPEHDVLISIPLRDGASASLPASLGILLAALATYIKEHYGYATKIVPSNRESYKELYAVRLVRGPLPSRADELAEATEHYNNPHCSCSGFGRVVLTELGERFLAAYEAYDELGKPKQTP